MKCKWWVRLSRGSATRTNRGKQWCKKFLDSPGKMLSEKCLGIPSFSIKKKLSKKHRVMIPGERRMLLSDTTLASCWVWRWLMHLNPVGWILKRCLRVKTTPTFFGLFSRVLQPSSADDNRRTSVVFLFFFLATNLLHRHFDHPPSFYARTVVWNMNIV